MFRKLTSHFFVLVAFAVISAHTIVPHHHHEVGTAHHGHEHEDHDLAHSLENFIHADYKSESYSRLIQPTDQFLLEFSIADHDIYEAHVSLRLTTFHTGDFDPPGSLFLNSALSLRAPPAIA